MPTAWEALVAKSTAPPGSTAWEHLVSTSPGGGFGTIYGETVVELQPDIEADIEADIVTSIDQSDFVVQIGADIIVECE